MKEITSKNVITAQWLWNGQFDREIMANTVKFIKNADCFYRYHRIVKVGI